MTPRSRRAVSALLCVLMLGASPAGSAAPEPDRRRASAAPVRVTQVTATASPTASGTRVRVGFTVENRTTSRVPARRAVMFIGNADDPGYSLGEASVPALRPGESRRVVATGKAGPRAVAGDYRVMVCLAPRPSGPCGGSEPAEVTLSPPRLVAPRRLDLDAVETGTASAGHTVALLNRGQSRTDPLDLELTGADADEFSLDPGTCTSSLAPGEECTLSVVSEPVTRGVTRAALHVDGHRGSAVDVVLTGRGLGPGQLVIDETDHDFPDTLTGDLATHTFTVTNTGDLPSGALVISLLGADSGDFTVDTTCPEALSAGASCTVAVGFTPRSRGAKTASVQVSGTPGGVVDADLTGLGLAPAALDIDPTSYAFGGHLTDTEPTHDLTVTNTGDVSGVIDTVLTTGAFSVASPSTCVGTLPPAASCVVEVTFQPSAAQAYAGDVTVSGPEVSVTASLTGAGVARVPALTADDPTFTFPDTGIGVPSTRTLTFTNTGTGTTPTMGTQLTGAGALSVLSDGCAGNALAPGGSCGVQVRFDPDDLGTYGGTLTVSAGSLSAPSAISATGVLPPGLVMLPRRFDFGAVPVGTTVAKSFTVYNNSDTNYLNGSVGIGGATGAFTADLASSSCWSTVLAPHQSCTLVLSFHPPSQATYSAFYTGVFSGQSISSRADGSGS